MRSECNGEIQINVKRNDCIIDKIVLLYLALLLCEYARGAIKKKHSEKQFTCCM